MAPANLTFSGFLFLVFYVLSCKSFLPPTHFAVPPTEIVHEVLKFVHITSIVFLNSFFVFFFNRVSTLVVY